MKGYLGVVGLLLGLSSSSVVGRPDSCGLDDVTSPLEIDIIQLSLKYKEIEGSVSGGDSDFEICCGDENLEDGETGNDVCRTSGMASNVAGWCGVEALVENNVTCSVQSTRCNHTLTMSLEVEKGDESDDGCCKDCHCVGDPVCKSFEQEEDEWIVCDARKVVSDEDTGEDLFCALGRTICKRQKDHAGNTCVWLPDENPGYTRQDGSKCQANWAESGYPTMIMYSKEGFTAELTLGELGYIIALDVNGHKLTSDSCYANHPATPGSVPANAWTPSSIPAGWNAETKSNDQEVLWKIRAEGVTMSVTCTKDIYGSTRLNVDNLVESIHNVEDAEGFCVEGKIAKTGTTERSKRIHKICRELNIGQGIQVCQGVFGPECNPLSYSTFVSDWCADAELSKVSGVSSSEQCENELADGFSGDVGSKWIEWICQINQLGIETCKNMISEDGWETFLSLHSDGLVNNGNGVVTCESDVTNYPTGDVDFCAEGITVEYYKDSEWKTAFFIPLNKLPCNGKLDIPFVDGVYGDLYKYPVRMAQCNLNAECIGENSCEPSFKWEGSFDYTVVCDDTPPNPNPEPESQCKCERYANESQVICVDDGNAPDMPGYYKLAECESCCVNDGEVINPETEICRTMRTEEPFCSEFFEDQAELCSQLRNDPEGKLTLEFKYDETSEEMYCCPECSLFGDPQGVSFYDAAAAKRHTDVWLICESRDPSPDSDCFRPRKSECEKYVDHEGRPCEWKQDIYDRLVGNWPMIGVIGSACVYNSASSEPTMVMYSFPGFEALAVLGERGIIEAMRFEVDGQNVALVADLCFEADDYAVFDGKTEAEVKAIFDKVSVTGDKYEKLWVLEVDNVYMRIACIRRFNPKDSSESESGMRLNVENLIDMDTDRKDGAGFCVEGTIDKQLDTTFNNDLFEQCHEGQEDFVHICRALWNPTCTKNSDAVRAVTEWCEKAYKYDSDVDQPEKCVEDVMKNANNNNKIASNWIKEYCKVIQNSFSGSISQCISNVNMETIKQAVEQYGTGAYTNECATSPSQYGLPPADGECNDGYTLQTFNTDTELWEDVLYIPAKFPPCNGKLELSVLDYPDLFFTQFRLKQCYGNTPECDMEVMCNAASGFDLYYKFTHSGTVCPDRRQLLSN